MKKRGREKRSGERNGENKKETSFKNVMEINVGRNIYGICVE